VTLAQNCRLGNATIFSSALRAGNNCDCDPS
jgi:hypothetical protein